jgi:hypothetical protein
MIKKIFQNGKDPFKGLLVSLGELKDMLHMLPSQGFVSLDTETTGVGHSDKPFSIQIFDGDTSWFIVLGDGDVTFLRPFFSNPKISYLIHNAIFDMSMLKKIGLDLAGPVYCTVGNAKLVDNKHNSYTLKSCAARINYEKLDVVEKYIEENKLYKVTLSKRYGGIKKISSPQYHLVPPEIMFEYGVHDAFITYKLGMWQLEQLKLMGGKERYNRVENSNL